MRQADISIPGRCYVPFTAGDNTCVLTMISRGTEWTAPATGAAAGPGLLLRGAAGARGVVVVGTRHGAQPTGTAGRRELCA